MARPFKRDINFLKHRRIFFVISTILIIVSVVTFFTRGLNYGIEFVGGTSIDFKNTGDLTIDQMRSACEREGLTGAIIQTTVDTRTGTPGFIVRIAETEAYVASAHADRIAADLGFSSMDVEVTTVGPGWGAEVTRTSLIAFVVALALIIIYLAIRFEYKMGLVAVLKVVHDLIIVIGIYAIVGREVTPNVIAALLTIMGYSLYDTVVVFHRINDNMSATARHSFMTVANYSINQVLMRTINTTLSTLIPVAAMLFFGGETLKDFAFAMMIGLVLGSSSSITLASPLYALWKQREPKFKKLAKKYGEGLDEFTVAELLTE